MSDKIQKLLAKVSPSDQVLLLSMMEVLKQGKPAGPDTKKLVGHADLFRVRKGKYRIIYKVKKDGVIIVDVKRRDDNTYNKF